ncbi:MAG: hypothetical protein GX263_02785 [Firmicutes bacterium]|nr:hypothetical protein [Bacillota bacterium]
MNNLQTVTAKRPIFAVECYSIKGGRGLRELFQRLAVGPVSRFLFFQGRFLE